MRLVVHCSGSRLDIPCGAGKQHMRWLALVAATRIQREKFPHAFCVPQRVTNHEGNSLRPRDVITDVLSDGEEVTVILRQGAQVPDDDFESREWIEDAYGPCSNLMECKFRWKTAVDPRLQQEIPKLVRGDFVVAPKWQGVYPQKDFGGRFEIPVEPQEGHEGAIDWLASRKGPPGTCTYKFICENGAEQTCKASPETLTADGHNHFAEFVWDVPIAPEPYPEIDSRPSTASSRDGAQVDPRFEQDWEAMRLKWVESFMKVRVKDVLTEFYAILIDLFDSYAFMGLDLSASQHTIGMDDWKHLIINCGLLEGQPEGSLSWQEICTWFEEAAAVRDGRPYLAQRLTRSHFLELLMRTAGWAMCENPRAQYVPEPGRPPMPLDEGLFRFITDILIPVMDVYDDDPIRKDAVQPECLAVIQQSRPSIRSIYAFLAQPWVHYDNEKVVVPDTLRFVFQFVKEKLEETEENPQGQEKDGDEDAADEEDAFGNVFAGEDKLTPDQVEIVVGSIDDAVTKVTANHPEPNEQRALLFWEFFEVMMQCCREMRMADTPLHEGIPAFVQTALAFMGFCDRGDVTLPDPPVAGTDDMDPGGEDEQ